MEPVETYYSIITSNRGACFAFGPVEQFLQSAHREAGTQSCVGHSSSREHVVISCLWLLAWGHQKEEEAKYVTRWLLPQRSHA